MYREQCIVYKYLLDGGVLKNFRWRRKGVLDREAVGYARRLVERGVN